MAFSWKKILDVAPRVLMGLLPGLGAGRGFVGSVAARTLAKNGLKGATFSYPDLTEDFHYDDMVDPGNVTYIGGKRTVLPALNTGWDMQDAKYALAQSLEKHNAAVANGTEKDLEEWWPGEDNRPRKVFRPHSTAVKGIMIDKDGNIQVQWHDSGKWYRYRGGDNIRETTEFVKDLMTAPSIGRAVAGRAKDGSAKRWPNSRHVNSEGKIDNTLGVVDPQVGWWGREHYDPTAKG